MEASSTEHVLSQQQPPERYLVSLGINDLPHVWTVLEPLLVKACEESRGEFSVPMILENMGLNTGVERWRIMAIIRQGSVQAAMVVCITQAGERRVLDCLLATGENAKEWPLVDDEFDAFAREYGCESVRIPCARKGWLKALPHWRMRGYVLEREI